MLEIKTNARSEMFFIFFFFLSFLLLLFFSFSSLYYARYRETEFAREKDENLFLPALDRSFSFRSRARGEDAHRTIINIRRKVKLQLFGRGKVVKNRATNFIQSFFLLRNKSEDPL